MSFKKIQFPLFFIGTFLTGFAGLVYQVVWQRYLAILIGSEAKSSSLVVSIFLIGLASGYFIFGKIMEKDWSRHKSMRFYGFVELAIGIYAILFPFLFQGYKTISFAGPNNFIFDVFIVVLCLFFPTFLMGASIPVLTTVLPESQEEVNTTHAKIYGWNTLGGCLGVFMSGFYLIPNFGLPYTIMITGVICIGVALIFLNNQLDGPAHKTQSVDRIENTLSTKMLYFLVFVVGSITISLEVIMMRLVGLAIGSSNMVFPIVLTTFIFGLGLGSLMLPNLKNSDGMYKRIVSVAALWSLIFLTVSYWPSWASHIRVSLTSIPSNYYFFNILLLLMFFSLFFIPVFFLGQILPIAYSLLDKTGEDYGKKCGFLYAYNTIGTAVGGLIFGYLILYFIDLEMVFKLNIMILALTCAAYAFYEKRKVFSVLAIAIFTFNIFPRWDRTDHVLGLFRETTSNSDMFKGLFHINKKPDRNVLYFQDGPNATLSIFDTPEVLNNPKAREVLEQLQLKTSVAVIMNGKSDGDTLGDFSTMYFAGALPYIFSNSNHPLKAAVVGFGTGLTTGTLAQSEQIQTIDSIEISHELLKARKLTSEANYKADSSPKVNHIHSDAFRHLTRSKEKYDLIITEPSNPWVTGVENLFAKDFLELASSKLTEDGILGMWFQRYDSNNQVVKAILQGVVENFQHYEVYEIGPGDSLIVMSQKPLTLNHFAKINSEPFHQKILSYLKIKDATDLHLIRSLNSNLIKIASAGNTLGNHSLEFPKLSDISNKLRFTAQQANMDTISEPEFDIYLNNIEENRVAFQNILKRYQEFSSCFEDNEHNTGIISFCSRVHMFIDQLHQYQNEKDLSKRILSYILLRRFGLIGPDNNFVLKAISEIIRNKLLQDPKYKNIFKDILQLSLLDNADGNSIINELEQIKTLYDKKAFNEVFNMVQQFRTNKKNALEIVKKL